MATINRIKPDLDRLKRWAFTVRFQSVSDPHDSFYSQDELQLSRALLSCSVQVGGTRMIMVIGRI